MFEQVLFRNHIGEEVQFGKGGIFVNENELHDYEWDFTSNNNKIYSFYRGVQEKKLPVVIVCQSEAEGIKIKNRLMEYMEKDVLANTHGRMIVGDYYLRCFVTASRKSNYLFRKGIMETELTITTDFPQWIRESTVSFRADGRVVSDQPISSSSWGKRNFDYNYDFPYDYMSSMRGKTLNNTGFVGTNFKIIIFGGAINPAVHIGGHTYQVNCMVDDGEYLTIDSLTKTITLTKVDGTTENHFNDRNRDSYIFEKIPPGNNEVTWNNRFGFDVVIFDERSEPKWT